MPDQTADPSTVGNNNLTGAGLGYFNVLARRWFFQDIGGAFVLAQLVLASGYYSSSSAYHRFAYVRKW